MTIRFKNPPVNELVIGAYFKPSLDDLNSEHIGLLWSRFRDDFPIVKQREPLSVNALSRAPTMRFDDEFFFMPRFWFISQDEVNLIQVQKDAFLLNWRKRESKYPNYADHLKPCFDHNFAKFEEFIREDVGRSELKIGLCELTYVDLIQPCDYWQGPHDTKRLISSFALPNWGSTESSALDFNCEYSYELEPNFQLKISLKTTNSNNTPSIPNLIIESRVTGLLDGASKAATDDWYEKAHGVLVDWFLKMTDRQIQEKHWQPEGLSK